MEIYSKKENIINDRGTLVFLQALSNTISKDKESKFKQRTLLKQYITNHLENINKYNSIFLVNLLGVLTKISKTSKMKDLIEINDLNM